MMAVVADALPFAFAFPPAHTAVMMIDMQRDFLEPGGFGETLGNDVGLLRSALTGARRLLDLAHAQGMTVIHTRECHRPDLSDCPPAKRERGEPRLRIGDAGPMGRVLIAGEPGVEIVAELPILPRDIVIDKPGKGAFYATPLGDILRERGITHLLFGGVTTEVCVQTTMREANDRGFQCLVVEDATESYFPAFKEATLDMMRAQGAIVGWTATSAQIEEAFRA
jgi:nicotinamidase-related amidase